MENPVWAFRVSALTLWLSASVSANSEFPIVSQTISEPKWKNLFPVLFFFLPFQWHKEQNAAVLHSGFSARSSGDASFVGANWTLGRILTSVRIILCREFFQSSVWQFTTSKCALKNEWLLLHRLMNSRYSALLRWWIMPALKMVSLVVIKVLLKWIRMSLKGEKKETCKNLLL